QRGRHTRGRRADVAAQYGNGSGTNYRCNPVARAFRNRIQARLGFVEMVARDDDVARVHVLCRYSARAERFRNEQGRDLLAKRGDRVEAPGRYVAERRESLGKARHLIAHRGDLRRDIGTSRGIAEKNLAHRDMAFADVLDRPQRADELAARRLLRDPEQLGRRAARCGNDYDGCATQAACNDIRSTANRIRVANRRAAELDDYHVLAT